MYLGLNDGLADELVAALAQRMAGGAELPWQETAPLGKAHPYDREFWLETAHGRIRLGRFVVPGQGLLSGLQVYKGNHLVCVTAPGGEGSAVWRLWDAAADQVHAARSPVDSAAAAREHVARLAADLGLTIS